MKKYFFIFAILVSCSKSQDNIVEDNSFLPVTINFNAVSNPCLGYYFIYPENSNTFKYNADSIPANSGIISFPANVKIKYHDLPDRCGISVDLIHIDEIKQ